MRLAFVYLAIFATCFLALGHPRDAPAGAGLQAGDQVRIRPLKVGHGFAPLFHLDLTVDPDGRITIPEFDLQLDVQGLQPGDAEVRIRSGLREASGLTRLELNVFATRDELPLPGQHCVMVLGQVHQPGPVALTPGMTLAQAVEAAGGTTPSGSPKRIRVYHEGGVTVHDLGNPAHAAGRLSRNDMIDVPGNAWVGR